MRRRWTTRVENGNEDSVALLAVRAFYASERIGHSLTRIDILSWEGEHTRPSLIFPTPPHLARQRCYGLCSPR